MHTLMVIAGGFLLLGVCLVVGRLRGDLARATLWFLPLWFIGALANMAVGVMRAGYTVAQEAAVFLVVFAVPAAAALALSRWFGRS